MNGSPPVWDSLWHIGKIATCDKTQAYGLIHQGAIGVTEGKIAWIGKAADLPTEASAKTTYQYPDALATPGLIDCHTHLVYAGNRAGEFEKRLTGVSYETIAREGGGILSTVKATREASETELFEQSAGRLQALLAEGVTTIEIKSGYGLETATELKMLRVARKLGEQFPVTVKTTFLGAHALPPEFNDKEKYIDYLCQEMLPAVAAEKCADAVDAFCENIGFSRAQVDKIFACATNLGLPVKLHAEQLTDQDGASLAASYQALSADHLEHLSDKGIEKMKQSGTHAVLLPGAWYFLRETIKPPVQKLREAAIPMALATDCNPGSSPTTSLLLMLNMACTFFGFTPLEALLGVTRHGAGALGLSTTHGSLEIGKSSDFALWQAEQPAELSYRFGYNPLIASVREGELRTSEVKS